ncbi:hypothetical protein HMPREF0262_00963 [Clostridium sp. ATCC 29733]|nr:hypothetical protein HMPREF0262_00963 [Clostridium sp. ATCC 29733]
MISNSAHSLSLQTDGKRSLQVCVRKSGTAVWNCSGPSPKGVVKFGSLISEIGRIGKEGPVRGPLFLSPLSPFAPPAAIAQQGGQGV